MFTISILVMDHAETSGLTTENFSCDCAMEFQNGYYYYCICHLKINLHAIELLICHTVL
jgi:hypothetical protein